ncbi:MAG: hypothetical protein A2017_18235 [Lentisphaerae bacterium GWF2_44_16]|nr:MAG: hypothetical protein A2017_18235 [Lentisphaerae bacterium GWF2_44_16]
MKIKEKAFHRTRQPLLSGYVCVSLAGCGGTGSQVLSGLARLHLSMRALGHPGGIHLKVFDPDKVTASNVGRQLFYQADIGRYKSDVLVSRINAAYGLDWDSHPEKFRSFVGDDITISCVDSRESRREIKKNLKTNSSYYVDCGNGPDYGQVLIGKRPDLPMPWEILPELIADVPEDNTPSCSLAEALGEQELFINQTVATYALQLLWKMFRHGGLDCAGYFINLTTGRTMPVPLKIIEKKAEKKRK